MKTSWRIDASTPEDCPIDSRAMVERDALGQWDLIDPRTGAKKRPVVVIESIDKYVPYQRRKKRHPDGLLDPKTGRPMMIEEPLNKLKLTFVGKRKYLIVGPTLRKTIEALYGTKPRAWIGKKITLYVDDKVTFGRKITGGLRIENRVPGGEPTPEPLDEEIDREIASRIEEAKGEFEEEAEG